MKWYEDQAYVSWQRRDGALTIYIDDAMEYAQSQDERSKDASQGKKPRRVISNVASSAVQLNSEYAAWMASMFVERQRCALYMETIIQFGFGVSVEDEEENERLKMAVNVGRRFLTGIRSGEHFTNVWKETKEEVEKKGNEEGEGEVSDEDGDEVG